MCIFMFIIIKTKTLNKLSKSYDSRSCKLSQTVKHAFLFRSIVSKWNNYNVGTYSITSISRSTEDWCPALTYSKWTISSFPSINFTDLCFKLYCFRRWSTKRTHSFRHLASYARAFTQLWFYVTPYCPISSTIFSVLIFTTRTSNIYLFGTLYVVLDILLFVCRNNQCDST